MDEPTEETNGLAEPGSIDEPTEESRASDQIEDAADTEPTTDDSDVVEMESVDADPDDDEIDEIEAEGPDQGAEIEAEVDEAPADDRDNARADDDQAAEQVDEPAEEANGFAELGLRPELLTALADLGYEEPTPIQRESIPPLLEGLDLLGQAATGTGKTAAFALPLLDHLGDERNVGDAPVALVLVPTRELAMQVSEAVHKYGRGLGARVVPIYGGQPIVRQLRVLERGVDVVVATPGRAIDHLKRGSLSLDEIGMVVLDEADEMFDMGFAEDIEAILQATPTDRQTVLFSATMPARVRGVAARYQRNPTRIEIARPVNKSGDEPKVRQIAYVVPRSYKSAALGRVIDVEAPAAAIVFCRTRHEVDQLTETLNGRGYRAEALHGGMNQEARDRVMNRVRANTTELLVATDVAARGLDIDQLTHVINYDVPSAPDAYVHRIGRVGRAGREGVAITLAEPREHRMLQNIERATGNKIKIEKVPTADDLRTRRIDTVRDAIREAAGSDDLDQYHAVIDAIADDFDLVQIALAAAKLLHEAAAGGEADDAEIPDLGNKPQRQERDQPREYRNKRDKFDKSDRGERPKRGSGGPTVRVFIGAGRSSGVRPGDLVGAIANEAGVSGRDIGSIEIGDRFSLVELPADSVDSVIKALKNTTIKGVKANVRRERFDSR